jgi:oligopeptide/dipeptide ABC transporter ATP-binding protein
MLSDHPTEPASPILQVIDLKQHFPVARTLGERLARRPRQRVHAVDGVSFNVQRGEILALVGESGSGKTTVGMNVLGLQTPTGGHIYFDGWEVASWARGKTLRVSETLRVSDHDPLPSGKRARILELRRRAQMVFQDPYESLNPRHTIYQIVAEPLEIHSLAKSTEHKRQLVRQALEDCGLTPAEHFWERYPDELSGGQRQRVVIAGALVLQPELLVADEPVSMLDVSIRAEVLSLLGALRHKRGVTILYTTHDLATAGYFTDRMAVMYLGRIVEIGPTAAVLQQPRHPYTQALVSVAPVPNPRRRRQRIILQGEPPNPIEVPSGCRFHPRCPLAVEACKREDPALLPVAPGHEAACLLLET